MSDRLPTSYRRIKMLHFLFNCKHTTRIELSSKFDISVNTVDNDIEYLTKLAPIYTKQGNSGGVYIMPEFKLYRNNLTTKEINCLYKIMDNMVGEDREIIFGIIMKSVNL